MSIDRTTLNARKYGNGYNMGGGGGNQSKPFVYSYFVDVTYHLICFKNQLNLFLRPLNVFLRPLIFFRHL